MNNSKDGSIKKKDCDIHLVVNGAVERTITENGTKKRVRRCATCNELFRTVEETEDFRANEERRRAEIMGSWHRKARESEEIVDGVKLIFDVMESVKEKVRVASGPGLGDKSDYEY